MTRASAVGLAVGTLAIAAVILLAGPSSLARVAEMRPAGLALVLLATAAITAISARKWRTILTAGLGGSDFHTTELFRVIGIGRLLGSFVQQDVGAAITQTAYLNRSRQVPVAAAAYSVALDRGLDFVALGALAPASALYAMRVLDAPAAAALAAALAGALLALGYVAHARALRALTRVYGAVAAIAAGVRRIARRRASSGPAQEAAPALDLSARQLTLLLVLSVARLLTVGLRVWLVAFAVGADLSLASLLLLTPIAQLALAVPVVPAGLGVYEAGWYGLLLATGAGEADALAVAVMQRLLSVLALAVVVALAELARRAQRRGRGAALPASEARG